MIKFFRKLRKPKYETLNKIEIEAPKILANFNYLKKLQGGAEIFPVLKANAYGHGLAEMCQILNHSEAKMVAVDSFPEAQIAWRYFKGKVLILSEMPQKAYDYCNLRKTEFVIYNEKTLRYVARYGKKFKLHLFYNSGMNREGVKDLTKFIEINKKYLDKVDVTGFCSHLSSAEERTVLNQEQEDKFFHALLFLRSAGYFPTWIHLGNSAAALKSNNRLLTVYRPGLALYGYNPLEEGSIDGIDSKLQPALRVFSSIVSIQSLEANEPVSYNSSYRAREKTNIAVIPFGYFEGLDRRLSNRGKFLVFGWQHNFWAQIAGKVCMNITCLDVGRNEIKLNDKVEIISSDPSDFNSISSLSSLMETIPYEILVKLQPSIRRKIVW